MDIIYLHGFNSDGDGWKAAALGRHFPQAQVWAPDLPAHPAEVEATVNYLVANCASTPLLIGSSLGGFYAYCAAARYQLPVHLFNPSLAPHLTLQGRGVGHFKTWTKQRDYHFKEAYLDILARMKSIADTAIDTKLLHFYLATDDDVLDFSKVAERYAGAQIQWVKDAGHGFSKFEKVLKQWKLAR